MFADKAIKRVPEAYIRFVFTLLFQVFYEFFDRCLLLGS